MIMVGVVVVVSEDVLSGAGFGLEVVGMFVADAGGEVEGVEEEAGRKTRHILPMLSLTLPRLVWAGTRRLRGLPGVWEKMW